MAKAIFEQELKFLFCVLPLDVTITFVIAKERSDCGNPLLLSYFFWINCRFAKGLLAVTKSYDFAKPNFDCISA
jgi:hypothetical protein